MSGFELVIRPDDDEPDAAEVLVDGAIDGRPYRFLLDTGAARSRVVADDFIASFPSVEATRASGLFGHDVRDVIVVSSIELGPLVRRDVALTRFRDDGAGHPNLLAMDVLHDARLLFLFDEARVEVDPDEVAAPDLRDLFMDALHHPYVELDFGSTRATAVWDTGASLTVVDEAFLRRHPECFEDAGESIGTDSSGVSMRTPMVAMSPCRIGGRAFGPHRAAVVDLAAVNATIEVPMDVIVGYNVMAGARWWMDFPARRWAVADRLVAA